MADLIPSLQIDDDWKKQAQEEKRKLAEAEAAKKAQPATAPAVASTGSPSTAAAGRAREVPQASFASLVQTVMTQALYYLGELGSRTGQSAVDLDLAKLQIDLLGVLETKTANNLSPDEKTLLDNALYDTRMRFVAVARDYVDLSGR
jgi:hypothetical protein